MYTLDEALPDSFQTYIDCLFATVSTLVVVTSITPVFAVALIPIIYFYRQQQIYFSRCYRELKRIDSVTRSPIHALFGETLDGPATIRAFGAQQALFDRMTRMVDVQQHAFFLLQSGFCWLAVRLEMIGSMIITFSCLAVVFEKRHFLEGDPVFAGLAGLSISYALSVTQSLNWAVRTGSDFEANMVSVERIRQCKFFYGKTLCLHFLSPSTFPFILAVADCNLTSEAPRRMAVDKLLSRAWPSEGAVEFKDARLRYRPGLPLVLNGLNIRIPPRSKVGIVGRTGAGESFSDWIRLSRRCHELPFSLSGVFL